MVVPVEIPEEGVFLRSGWRKDVIAHVQIVLQREIDLVNSVASVLFFVEITEVLQPIEIIKLLLAFDEIRGFRGAFASEISAGGRAGDAIPIGLRFGFGEPSERRHGQSGGDDQARNA